MKTDQKLPEGAVPFGWLGVGDYFHPLSEEGQAMRHELWCKLEKARERATGDKLNACLLEDGGTILPGDGQSPYDFVDTWTLVVPR